MSAEVGAVDDRPEVAAGARAEAVAELVDRPQVDAGGVEREAVAVIEAGVLAEAMQEDDRGAGLGSCPVPVVRAALRMVDERHSSTLACAEEHFALFGHPRPDRVHDRRDLRPAQRLGAGDEPVRQLDRDRLG